LWLFLFILYFTFFYHYGGQTPGKMMMGLRVVTANLEELSLFQALFRTLSYFLSGFPLGIGFLMALLDQDKRALHDFIAGTRVVRT